MIKKSEIRTVLKRRYNIYPSKINSLTSDQGNVFEIKSKKNYYILKIYDSKDHSIEERTISDTIRLLDFLQKTNFSYQFPTPLSDNKGSLVLNYNSFSGILYKRIGGSGLKSVNLNQVKEIAKLLAVFHKKTGRFVVNKGVVKFHKFLRFNSLDEYDFLAKTNTLKNKTFFLSNLNFMQEVFDYSIRNISFSDFGVIHSDVNLNNLISNEGKIKGLIDFENYNRAPRIFDIAYAIKMTCFKYDKIDFLKLKNFLKTYSRFNSLPKNFHKDLFPSILLDHSIYFFRAYYKGRTKELYETVKSTKLIFNLMKNAQAYNKLVTLLKSLNRQI